MESESWLDNYLQPISLGAEDAEMPKMQLYKDISELRIQPDEGTTNHENRTQFTFTNRNLDIIQNLHEAYIEYTCEFDSTKIVVATDTPGADSYNNVHDEFFQAQADVFDDRSTQAADMNRLNVILDATSGQPLVRTFLPFFAHCLPQTAFWIDGYTFEINDTTVSTQNSGLARALNVLNDGKYAKESRQLSLYGMTKSGDSKSPFEVQKFKLATKNMKLKVPLKYIIPYLSQNKISWGVKTALKITRLSDSTLTEMFNFKPGTAGDFSVAIKDLELVIPYVKLENNKQLSLWNQMYSSVNNRYWLENDHFTSSTYDNKVDQNNEVYRIATKGLNSRPRWLLLSAIDPDVKNTDAWHDYSYSAYTPLGFSNVYMSRYVDAAHFENSVRFTKIRVKINGIYIDGGDVMEFTNKAADRSVTSHPRNSYGGDYFLAYENYCKFFGSYHSKRASPKDFEEWLGEQVFCFDLVNIDAENIFANSGNALIIEVEFSTKQGAVSDHATGKFKLVANVLYDKQLSISHSNNSAVLTVT